METVFAALFLKLLSSLLSELSKAGFKRLISGTPTGKAIQLTVRDFEFGACRTRVTEWCKSDNFLEELERLSNSADAVEINIINDSFIATGEFYDNVSFSTHREPPEKSSPVFSNIWKPSFTKPNSPH